MAALRSPGMLAARCLQSVSFRKTGIFNNDDFDHNFQEAAIEIDIF
jgi:hypothetical protein